MFSRPKKASKKWHTKALMIDPKKTTLVLDTGFAKSEHVPPWLHKSELNQDVKEFLHLSNYDYPRL